MVVTDEQIAAGFVAMASAVVALSAAVVYLFRRDGKCQAKLAKLSQEFELILHALGDPTPPKRKRRPSGEHRTLP